MTTKAISGPVPVELIDELRASYGRLRLLLAVLQVPRPRPGPRLRTAPVPTDGHLRADLGLAPIPNPSLVAGCLWLRVL